MLTEKDILETLDNTHQHSYYRPFIELGHPYSYLIDCRLNVFRDDGQRWAIAAERLGYNPRGGAIRLEVFYFGNCIINLDHYNKQDTNYYTLMPIDGSSFNETVEDESLKPDATYWIVRGQKIFLSHNKQEYLDAGIELKEIEPNEISIEEVGRLLIMKYHDLFRATDEELYKSLPADLRKILVLDQWYHKDFRALPVFEMSEADIRHTYEFNRNNYYALKGTDAEPFTDYEPYAATLKRALQSHIDINQNEWKNNRPSSYETWQQIARVIIAGNPLLYKPTIEANTHWKYWPDSGSL